MIEETRIAKVLWKEEDKNRKYTIRDLNIYIKVCDIEEHI